MNKGFILAAPCMAALAACGGSSTGNTSFQTLSVLPNGDGVARGISATGQEALIYSPDISAIVSAANAASSSDIANVTASDFPVTSSNGNVRVRSGTMTSEGITINVTAVEDLRTTEAAAIFLEMSDGYSDVTMITGTAYSNAPTGTYTYSGTQMTTANNGLAPGSTGNFTMSANFAQETFQYNGSSGGVGVTGNGVLDTANGRFATSNLNVTSGGSSNSGTMHGLMHGSGATSTSGIFHTSGSFPLTGAFIGSR